MRCRQCGHQNESGANFCSSCGSPLPREDEATLSLTELAERLELDEELGAALAELPEGMGMLVVRRGPNAGSRYVLDAESGEAGDQPGGQLAVDLVDSALGPRGARHRHRVREVAAVEHSPAAGGTAHDLDPETGARVGVDVVVGLEAPE